MINFLKTFINKKPLVEELCSNNSTLPVVWIHGANQSSLSFEYLRSKTNFDNEILINYSSTDGFYANLSNMVDKIKKHGPVFIVGHSLGGIYALHLLENVEVAGVVSISTPYRGSSAADWAKFIVPSYQLFKDVGRRSRPIMSAHNIEITIPYTQVVSTTGSVPYLSGPNDGVVTVASMKHRNEMEHIEVDNTHYEVMCSNTVAEIITSRYSQHSYQEPNVNC